MFRRPPGYWTEARCRAAAKRCKTRSRFKAQHAGAYSAAQRMGLLDSFFDPPGYWTEARCRAAAKRCKTRSRFKAQHAGAYRAARKMGVLDLICQHMVNGRTLVRYWTEERCRAIANGFKTKTAFRKRYPGAYLAAHRQGWIDRICKHMRPSSAGRSRVIYSIQNSRERLAYVGLTVDLKERYRNHLANPQASTSVILSRPHRVVILDTVSIADAAQAEADHIERLRSLGWTVVNTAKAGALGGTESSLTLAAMRRLARSCSSPSEFQRRFPSAYRRALRLKCLQEVVGDLPRLRDRFIPSMHELAKRAARCKRRSEFKAQYPGAYKAARKMGVLDRICEHMGGLSIKDPKV